MHTHTCDITLHTCAHVHTMTGDTNYRAQTARSLYVWHTPRFCIHMCDITHHTHTHVWHYHDTRVTYAGFGHFVRGNLLALHRAFAHPTLLQLVRSRQLRPRPDLCQATWLASHVRRWYDQIHMGGIISQVEFAAVIWLQSYVRHDSICR